MFAYCGNNAIVYSDPSGNTWAVSNEYGATPMTYRSGGTVYLPCPWDENGERPARTDWARFWRNVKNYDKSNTNEQKVVESYFFSSYKGSLVVRYHSDVLTSGAFFGVIFLNHNTDELAASNGYFVFQHEYGHILQQEEMGQAKYTLAVGIPSITCNILSRNNTNLSANYYSLPWEYDANMRANINTPTAAWAGDVWSFYLMFWGELP